MIASPETVAEIPVIELFLLISAARLFALSVAVAPSTALIVNGSLLHLVHHQDQM